MSDIIERLRATQDDWPAALVELEREAAAEIARLRALTEWQDISTAPRDGTEVLAWGTLHLDGIWAGEQPSRHVTRWHEDYGWVSPALGGWEPTRWMPLPTPPEDA